MGPTSFHIDFFLAGFIYPDSRFDNNCCRNLSIWGMEILFIFLYRNDDWLNCSILPRKIIRKAFC